MYQHPTSQVTTCEIENVTKASRVDLANPGREGAGMGVCILGNLPGHASLEEAK